MTRGLLVIAIFCLACAPKAAQPGAEAAPAKADAAAVTTPPPHPTELPIQTAMRDWAASWETALEPMREPIAKMEAGSTDRADCNALIVGVRNAQLVAKLAPDEDIEQAAYSMLSTFGETGKACLRQEGNNRDIGVITGRAGSTLINSMLYERYQLSAAAWLNSPDESAAAERTLDLIEKKKAEAARQHAAREVALEAQRRENESRMKIADARHDAAIDAFTFCNHLPLSESPPCTLEARACENQFGNDDLAAADCYRAVVAAHRRRQPQQ
jgi:hypothetical protein